jgi:hypothetical protein
VAAATVLGLTACGGGTDAAATASPAASTSAGASAAPATTQAEAGGASEAAEPAEGGALPDPCGLLSQDELAAILGSAPGKGEWAGSSPNLRQVCTYPDSTILGVEVGADYAGSIAAIETAGLGGKVSELPGVGEKAVFVTYDMGIAQVFALKGGYMVDVTGMLKKQQVVGLAEAMLAKL